MITMDVENAVKIISESSNILITLPEKSGADALGSALALSKTLADIEKKNSIITKNQGDKFQFLHGIETIQHILEQEQNFIISVNTKEISVSKFHYTKTDDSLDIFLTPKDGGVLEAKNVRFKYGNFDYDLIVALNTPSLEYLGGIFSDNSAFFYTTTIINIDHTAENANFGNLNLVYLKANSVAEIIFELIGALRKESIDGNVATNLLSGIIEKTNSFKRATVTPQAFRTASELMALGGQRELIIKNLYQNKSLSILKLLGRGLARLRREDSNIYWTALNSDDFARSGTERLDVSEIFEELLEYAKSARAIVLFFQKNGSIFVEMRLLNSRHDMRIVFAEFSPAGDEKHISFTVAEADITSLRIKVLGTLEGVLKN